MGAWQAKQSVKSAFAHSAGGFDAVSAIMSPCGRFLVWRVVRSNETKTSSKMGAQLAAESKKRRKAAKRTAASGVEEIRT